MNTAVSQYSDQDLGNNVSNGVIQASLQVGSVNDPLEHEADAVADQVMRMPENGLIQRKCSQCDEEDKAMRKPLASFIQKKGEQGGMRASESVSNRIHNSRGKGNNLSGNTKGFMESRFGTEFSNVNIHTGREAAELSQNLGAKAFTVGSDIYFNKGQYDPGSNEGKRLLAHELTHTVQQTSSIQRQPAPSSPSSNPDERVDVNFDLSNFNVKVILDSSDDYDLEASANFAEPLNLIREVFRTPALSIPPSSSRVSLDYANNCNGNVQQLGIFAQQIQVAGRNVFDFRNSDYSVGIDGSFRFRNILFNPSIQTNFNRNNLQGVSFGLTISSTSTSIPSHCLNTPTNPVPSDGGDTNDGSDRPFCAGIDCERPATIENASQHLVCCIGTPEPQETPSTPQVSARTIYFFYDTPIFKEASNETLARVLDMMQTLSSVHVQITGHTSIEGTEEHNQGLSERRAQAVSTYLVLHGIDSSRIQLLSMGENAPAVGEPSEPSPQSLRLPANEAIRDLNRRAEVVFFDPTGTLDYLPSSPPMILTLPDRSLRMRVD